MPEEIPKDSRLWIISHCHFCETELEIDADGMYHPDEVVGEFWSNKRQDTVIAHPDCLPEGTLEGTNEEWSMA